MMCYGICPTASLFKGPDFEVIEDDDVGQVYRTRHTADLKSTTKQEAGITVETVTDTDTDVHVVGDHLDSAAKTANKTHKWNTNDDESDKKLFGAVRALKVRH